MFTSDARRPLHELTIHPSCPSRNKHHQRITRAGEEPRSADTNLVASGQRVARPVSDQRAGEHAERHDGQEGAGARQVRVRPLPVRLPGDTHSRHTQT